MTFQVIFPESDTFVFKKKIRFASAHSRTRYIIKFYLIEILKIVAS